MLRTGGLHPPKEGLTPRFAAGVSPDAGGLLQRRLGPSFGRTYTGKSSGALQDALCTPLSPATKV